MRGCYARVPVAELASVAELVEATSTSTSTQHPFDRLRDRLDRLKDRLRQGASTQRESGTSTMEGPGTGDVRAVVSAPTVDARE